MTVRRFITRALIAIAGSLVLSVLYYVVFSLLFSTDVEKELIRENRLYAEELPEAEMATEMVSDVMELLHMRDKNIYLSVFKAELPQVGDMLEGKPADASSSAAQTESSWRAIFDTLAVKKIIPPMQLPLENLNYTNVGASVGERMNPFYKVKVHHDGMDFVANEGTEVLATASGIVTKVQSSEGGKGNMVEISHAGGYVTRYAHLLKTLVRKGERVKAGKAIGLVGASGRAFTTHLHYEVLHDGEVMDPVHFFFSSLTPDEYADFLAMSSSSGQSMD